MGLKSNPRQRPGARFARRGFGGGEEVAGGGAPARNAQSYIRIRQTLIYRGRLRRKMAGELGGFVARRNASAGRNPHPAGSQNTKNDKADDSSSPVPSGTGAGNRRAMKVA